MNTMLHKHCIYINLISHLEHNLCNNSAKREIWREKFVIEGDLEGEICERGRFMSPTWETFSKREIDPKRGSLPPKEGDLTCMGLYLLQFQSYCQG